MRLTLILGGVFIPVQILATVLAIARGYWPARIYLIGVVIMSLSGIVGLGVAWGFIESNSLTALTSAVVFIAMAVTGTVSLHVEDKVKDINHIRRLKELQNKLATTEENERQRIAKDLHDGVCQLLTGALLEITMSRDAANDDHHRDHFNSGIKAIEQAHDQARKVLYDLTSPVLHTLGLEAAVQEELSDLERRFKLSSKLAVECTSPDLEISRLTILLRMFREILINVVKHASAQTVTVSLTYNPDGVTLRVQDDGVGFDTNEKRTSSKLGSGIGLWGMSDQANSIGGNVIIRSAIGKGTTAILTLPVLQRVATEGAET
jgi:two-component system sensor histidine kinase NreB